MFTYGKAVAVGAVVGVGKDASRVGCLGDRVLLISSTRPGHRANEHLSLDVGGADGASGEARLGWRSRIQ